MFYIFFSATTETMWSLAITMAFTSCLASCSTALGWGSKEIRKYQENHKTAWNYSQVLSLTPKRKVFVITGQTLINLPQAPSNLNLLIIFVTLKPFTQL